MPINQNVVTAERTERLIALYPTVLPQTLIVERLNELPGPKVELADLRVWAMSLGVRRPHYGSGEMSILAQIRTPARDHVVASRYPTMATDSDIVTEVNVLPGRRDLPRSHLAAYAAVLGVWRSAEFRAWRLAHPQGFVVAAAPPNEVLAVETIDYDGAYWWGVRLGVVMGDDIEKNLKAINLMRAKYKLPRYALRNRVLGPQPQPVDS